MGKYIISCCSTVDLTEDQLKSRDIKHVCFHFSIDGKEYFDDLGKSVPFDVFYKAMATGAETKTSQVNVDEFTQFFSQYLEKGYDIIHVAISSGISGTFNSATIARNELLEKYPDRKLYIVDSLAASGGQGMLVDKLADLRDAGLTIDELYDWVRSHKLELHHWFFSTDLTFFVKGGRITKASGWFGTILKICPLLNVDKNGKLVPREKIRTKAKVIKAIAEKMELFARDGLEYSDKCIITHSGCYDDARAVADIIEAKFKDLKCPVIINSIGTTIGSHTGPGTVALFFWGKKRED